MPSSAEPTPLPARRRRVFALLAVLLTTGLAFVLLEAGLRVFRPDLHPESGNVLRTCHTFDPTTGWRPAAHCAGRFVKEDFDTRVSTNGLGLRGAEVDVAAPPGIRRVVVLGDSFAWGFGVDDDDTFAAHLDRSVAHSQTLNLGVCGYGTDQAVLRYQEVGRPFAPSVVVLAFFAGNDFANNMEGRSNTTFRPYFTFEPDGTLRAQNLPLPERPTVLPTRVTGVDEVAAEWLFTYRYLHLKAKLLSATLKESPLLARVRSGRKQRALEAEGRRRALPLHTADPPAETREAIAITLGLLELLRADVAADGARLVLLLIPQRAEVIPGAWARELRKRNLDPALHDRARPQRLVTEWAATHGVPTVNLFEAFVDRPETKGYYLPADRHLNPTGHAYVATLLRPYIEDALAAAGSPG